MALGLQRGLLQPWDYRGVHFSGVAIYMYDTVSEFVIRYPGKRGCPAYRPGGTRANIQIVHAPNLRPSTQTLTPHPYNRKVEMTRDLAGGRAAKSFRVTISII